jgi:hypothetical protein
VRPVLGQEGGELAAAVSAVVAKGMLCPIGGDRKEESWSLI